MTLQRYRFSSLETWGFSFPYSAEENEEFFSQLRSDLYPSPLLANGEIEKGNSFIQVTFPFAKTSILLHGQYVFDVKARIGESIYTIHSGVISNV